MKPPTVLPFTRQTTLAFPAVTALFELYVHARKLPDVLTLVSSGPADVEIPVPEVNTNCDPAVVAPAGVVAPASPLVYVIVILLFLHPKRPALLPLAVHTSR